MAFTLYGLFVNISKLNKAAAVMILALLNVLCMPAAHIKKMVKRVSKAIGNTPQRAVDAIMGPEWVRAFFRVLGF